jgi:prepilin-type N-terminal cleavage/methylation domain-containing protein
MKSLLTPIKRQDGFTLVELMVVVAIIGLLSAVAIPNFKKYQAKSKMSEAKLQLSALYTAQAAFFSDFNIYAACLRYMGFDPHPETANRYYAIGFPDDIDTRAPEAHLAAINAGLQTTDGTIGATVDQCSDAGIAPADRPGTAYDPTDLLTNDYRWYHAGRGMGAQIMDEAGKAAANAAGASVSCTRTDLAIIAAAGFGSCVGTQADTETMVYQASAVGFISADFVTDATASGININQDKIIKIPVQGY